LGDQVARMQALALVLEREVLLVARLRNAQHVHECRAPCVTSIGWVGCPAIVTRVPIAHLRLRRFAVSFSGSTLRE
jgi:hypothetical protein